MTNTISRRDFLKLGGAAFGALATGQFIPPLVAQAAVKPVILMPAIAATFPACARCAYGDVACWLKLRMDVWSSWKAIRIIRTPKANYVRGGKRD